MKLKWAAAILGVVFLAAQASAAGTPVLKTDMDKESYALGVDLARNLKHQGIAAAEADALANGLRDEFAGGKLLLSEQELSAALTAYQTELKQRRARPMTAVAEANQKEGAAFLAENKTAEGVVTLPSGVQYKIIREGNGKTPTKDDTVEVNYRGTFINGVEFENSYRRGQPMNMKVSGGGGVAGLTEVLKLMPAGSKWQVFIPPQLAYGAKGSGRKVGPNATLIFEVELLAVK
jgi:FKBP-type peptidyl-prolyl cis-trans isomerase FklB